MNGLLNLHFSRVTGGVPVPMNRPPGPYQPLREVGRWTNIRRPAPMQNPEMSGPWYSTLSGTLDVSRGMKYAASIAPPSGRGYSPIPSVTALQRYATPIVNGTTPQASANAPQFAAPVPAGVPIHASGSSFSRMIAALPMPYVSGPVSTAAGKPVFHATLSPGNIGDIWDDITSVTSYLKAKVTSTIAGQFDSQLTNYMAQLKAKLGTFLTTQQTLLNLKTRATAQMNSSNPDVKTRATAAAAQAGALLTQYDSIEGSATTLAAQLTALKSQLTSDPMFQVPDPSSLGTQVVNLFNTYKDTLASAIANTVTTIKRMDDHISQVNTLANDVTSLENFAQGKGFSATFSGIGSSLLGAGTSVLKPVAIVAAVGLGVYLLAPSFIGRMRRS